MFIKQIFKPTDERYSEFAIGGTGFASPVPDTGDIVHWTAKKKTYSAKVQSKAFSYDTDEISLARTDDWGLTITIIVDVIEGA